MIPDAAAVPPADPLPSDHAVEPLAAATESSQSPLAPEPTEVPSFHSEAVTSSAHPETEPAGAEGLEVPAAAPVFATPAAAPVGAAWEPAGLPTPPAPPSAADAATETEAAFTTDAAAEGVTPESEPAPTVAQPATSEVFSSAVPAEIPPVEPIRIEAAAPGITREGAPLEDHPADPFQATDQATDEATDEEGVVAADPEHSLPRYGAPVSPLDPEVPQSDSEIHPGFAGYGAPVTETPGYPAPESAESPEAQPAAPPPVVETGPNWMLAFVCAWSGGFSLFQIGEYVHRTELAVAQRQLAMGGFASLGLGLLLFGLEALTWGKRREAAQRTLLLLLPLILTVIGLICLYFFHDPDPTKGRI